LFEFLLQKYRAAKLEQYRVEGIFLMILQNQFINPYLILFFENRLVITRPAMLKISTIMVSSRAAA
jgi:hypothetical protein